jgi:hypothetical protein
MRARDEAPAKAPQKLQGHPSKAYVTACTDHFWKHEAGKFAKDFERATMVNHLKRQGCDDQARMPKP